MLNKVREFFSRAKTMVNEDEDGLESMEYIGLAAVVLIVLIAVVSTIVKKVKKRGEDTSTCFDTGGTCVS